jgi:hypothetical protein
MPAIDHQLESFLVVLLSVRLLHSNRAADLLTIRFVAEWVRLSLQRF